MVERRQGCLQGLLELFLLNQIFNWGESRFGYGRGCSCTGFGCGTIMLIVFLVLVCQIIFGTNWFRL
jgi:hypothetical protein